MKLGYHLLALATLGGGGTTIAITSKSVSPQESIIPKAKVASSSRNSNFGVQAPTLSPKSQSLSPEPEKATLARSLQEDATNPDSILKSQITSSTLDLSLQSLTTILPTILSQEPTISIGLPVPSSEISLPTHSEAPEAKIIHLESQETLPPKQVASHPKPSDSPNKESTSLPENSVSAESEQLPSIGEQHINVESSSTSVQESADLANQLPTSLKEPSDSLPQDLDRLPETLASLGQSSLEGDPLPDVVEDEEDNTGNCEFLSFAETSIPTEFGVTDGNYFSVLCDNAPENDSLGSDKWVGFFPKSFFSVKWGISANKKIGIQSEYVDIEDLVSTDEQEENDDKWQLGIKFLSPKLVGSESIDAKVAYYSGGEEVKGTWMKVQPTTQEETIYLLLKDED